MAGNLSMPVYCVIIVRADRLTSGQALVLFQQFLLAFYMIGIMRNAVDRTHFDTLGCFIVTNTLGTQIGIDHVDFITGADSLVRALGFTHIAIDAFICNI